MNTKSLEQVRESIINTYNQIWRDWYSDTADKSKASVQVELNDCSAGYSHSENLIYIPICDGNLDDEDSLEPKNWPIWRVELIHEMLHEWQHKKPCQPTQESDHLHLRFGKTFSGKGHDSAFFQAIIEKATYFNITPQELIEAI